MDWTRARSAYIHVPFCRHRCGYCNFSVVAGRDDLIDRYLAAIDRELKSLDCPQVDTVYIGGGTPTHLDRPYLERLLQIVHRRFALASKIEWSVEANPEDITSEKLSVLKDFGVNRLSLGVQSFDNRKLKVLERGHTGRAAQRIVCEVTDSIPNVSVDLIFAVPGETTAVWQSDLDTALSLPIQHLSTYTLTYERGTSFWSRRRRGDLQPQSETIEVEMYQAARAATSQAGLMQYEISSFARTDRRSRHNMVYWQGSPWFGAGPGAARFIDGLRETNHRSTTTYLKRIESGIQPTAETESISPTTHVRERLAFGIRMIEGVNVRVIARETGIDPYDLCAQAMTENEQDRFIQRHDERIRLTERGILYADLVASRFLA